MSGIVHVIGAGLAGLSAATRLAERGERVVLHEAAKAAGGRCRSYRDTTLGLDIDNGNHLLLSGNHAAMDYLNRVGGLGAMWIAPEAAFDFVDLRDGKTWRLRPNAGRLPWWVLAPSRRVPNTRAADYLAPLPLLKSGRGTTIGEAMRCDGPLWERLWEPVLLAALNTEPRAGSAALAGKVLRETLGAGGNACRPMVATGGLSAAFVEPALAYLRARGGEARFGVRLRALHVNGAALPHAEVPAIGRPRSTQDGASFEAPLREAPQVERGGRQRVTALVFVEGEAAIGPDDRIVLAVPPWVAAEIVPSLSVPTEHRSIVNAHFAALPDPAQPPLLGLVGGTTEWLFAYPDRLSVTISAADRLLEVPREELAATIWREIAPLAGRAGGPLPAWQIVREKRATFAATPAMDALRPAARTHFANLALAGDWTDTGLPATIEGAIRSGVAAADLLQLSRGAASRAVAEA